MTLYLRRLGIRYGARSELVGRCLLVTATLPPTDWLLEPISLTALLRRCCEASANPSGSGEQLG